MKMSSELFGYWKIKILFSLVLLAFQSSSFVDGECYVVDPLQSDFITAITLSTNLTLPSSKHCVEECTKQNFIYAALQEASYCFCGNDVTGFTASTCPSKCQDNSECGGEDIEGLMTILPAGSTASGGGEGYISMTTTVDTTAVLIKDTVTVTVNASGNYTIDWGDGSTFVTNDTDHVYALPGYYYVFAYLESANEYSSSMYVRVHDSPVFTVDCPTMLEISVPKECGVVAYRQGYDYTVNWNMTNATHVIEFKAKVPDEQIVVIGSASETTDTLSASTIATGTLVVLHNSENQLGEVLIRIKGTFQAAGSLAVYALNPTCSSNSYCGISDSCTASCLASDSPLTCGKEFCSLSTICQDTCSANAAPGTSYTAVLLTTIEITGTDFDYDIPIPAKVPVGVKIAVGCAADADCPSGLAAPQTRPLGPTESPEEQFDTASKSISTFSGRHVVQLIVRGDPMFDLNFTIVCLEAAPFAKKDVPTPYDASTEQYIHKGSLSLDYAIYSDIAVNPPKSEKPGICQEAILPPVLNEIWIEFGITYNNYLITFNQGSSLFTVIDYGDGSPLLYDYMDYADGGYDLDLTLTYANEGVFFLEGNTTNAIGSVQYNASIHVVPPVTNTWTAKFTCPCLDSAEGFPLTVSFPSADHPPWNATFNATYVDGTLVTLFSELIDFGTFGANGAAAPLEISKTTVFSKSGDYSIKIFLQNEISNTTIIVNVTVKAAIRNVTGSFFWDNKGTITPGMGTDKNTFMTNNTVYIYPTSATGIPDKWKLKINESGKIFETTSAQENFTYVWDDEGTYTIIVSGYNAVQGWVDSVPMQVKIVNQIKGFFLTDDNIIRKANESKIIEASFEQFTPMSCVRIDYGDGSTYELYGDLAVCKKQFSDLDTSTEMKYIGPVSTMPIKMNHTYAAEGTYTVRANAYDNKGHEEYSELSVLIGDLPCTMPVVQIIDGIKVIDSAKVPQIQMTFFKELDTKVEFNCTTKISFKRYWSIIEVYPTGNPIRSVTLEGVLVSWNVSSIVLPPRFLTEGLYKLIYTIEIVPENTNSRLQRDDYTYLRIIPSPLRPILISGSAIRIKRGIGQFVILEPELSYDPDYPDSKEMNRTVWCRQVSPNDDGDFPMEADGTHAKINPHKIPTTSDASLTDEGCFGKGLGVILLPDYNKYQLDTLFMEQYVGTYEFLLEMQKYSRNASVTLTLDLVLEPLPNVEIECVNNLCTETQAGLYFNPTTRLALVGSCISSCGDDGIVYYTWSIRAKNGDPVSVVSGCVSGGSTVVPMESPDCDEPFLTASNESAIALSPYFFSINGAIDEFIFTLTGTVTLGYSGSTEILLIRNKPPDYGKCTLAGSGSTYTSSCIDPNWIDPEGMGINTYTYYYFNKGVIKSIISTVKSVMGLTLPNGNYTLYVDISDVLGAFTTYTLGPVNINETNFDPSNWQDLAAKDTKSLWMALMQYPSIRDSALNYSLNPNDIANMTEDEIKARITYIAQTNTLAMQLLYNTSSFSTMGEINAGSSILQSIMEGIFKSELGAQTIDMEGRAECLKVLQKMVDQVPNVGNTSPDDLQTFLCNFLDIVSAGILGTNKNLQGLSGCAPTDMAKAPFIEYDGDVKKNTYVSEDMCTTLCNTVRENTIRDAKIQTNQMFDMMNSMTNQLLKLSVIGETCRANAPNGASLILMKVLEKILINGLTISAEKNMHAETQFPKNFCPSRCIMPNTDCNQVLGLQMVIWPCITHIYPDSSSVLSNTTRIIDVDVIINEQKIEVKNQTSNIIIKIPRGNDSINTELIVNASEEMNNLTRFIYHIFNISIPMSSFTMEIKPQSTIDDNMVIVVDFERMPTPSKYWFLKVIKNDFVYSNGSYKYFVGSVENNNRTGRFFIAFAVLKAPFKPLENLTKDDFKENFNLQYSFKVYSSGCYYFNSLRVEWVAEGLYVNETTPELITCSVNHLTPFGFGYTPSINMINFEYVFAHVGFIDNLTLYLVLIIVGCLYILLMIWACIMDRRDLKLRGVIPLPDNDQRDKYLYELTFFTGPDGQATTDSNIYIILSGEYEETEVRRMPPAQNKLYRRFGVDSFVMATPRPLGPLLYLRVFHDNSGEPPLDGWQLQMVVIRDLQLSEKYIFDTNAWLAFYRGDGKIDQTFIPYEGKDEKTFSQNMYIRSNKSANQDHMWMSIFVRPIGSRYSRKERVSVCFSFLFLSMLIDAMWYNIQEESSKNSSFDWGPFSFSLSLLITGACIVLVIYPVIYILILIFKRARPKSLKRCRALDSIEMQRKDQYEAEGANLLDDDSKIKVEINENIEGKPKDISDVRCIPWWTRIIAWIVMIGSIAASVFFVWSYGIMWGEIKTVKWFSSFILTFFISILVTQWIKVAIHGLVSACCKFDLSAEDVDCDEELPGLKTNEEWQHPKYMDPTYRKKVHRVIGVDIENPETASIRKRMQKEYEIKYVMRGLFAYGVFLAIIMIISNGRTDPNALLMKEHFENTFIQDKDMEHQFVDMIKSSTDWWMWAKLSVIQKLRAQRYYNGATPFGLRGFLDDKVNRIMGYALLRQIRSKRYNCEVPSPMDKVVKHCSGMRGMLTEESQHFCAGWIFNESFPGACNWEEFQHKTSADLGTYPFTGRLGDYSGGGYIIRLSGNQDDIIKRLDDLQRNNWVDKNTRAIILEFSVYNANVNLFCKCMVLAEFNEGGGIVPKWRFEGLRLIKDTGFKGFLTTICEIGFVVATVFFTIRELWEIKKLKVKYFYSYWNIAELCILVISFIAIGLYAYRYVLTKEAMEEFNATGGNGYVRIDSAAYVDDIFSISCAAIVFFSTLKLIKLLQFNKRMDVLALTIRLCWDDLKIFFIAFGIIFFAFSCLFFFMFTPFLEEFARLLTAIQTTFAMMLGKFDFEAMKQVNFFSPLLFFVFSLINAMILVNVMLTIILQAFNEVKLELAKIDNRLNVIDFVWTSFRRFIRTENLPKIHVQPNFNDRAGKLSDKPSEDTNTENLPDKVSMLLKYINDMYFDGRLDLNDPYSKRTLMGSAAPKMLPFHDPTTFGIRKIANSEDT